MKNPHHTPAFTHSPVSGKSSNRTEFALQAAGIGVWEVDLVTNEAFWDDQSRKLLGLTTEDEHSYEEIIRRLCPPDAERVNEQLQAALRGDNGGIYNTTCSIAETDHKPQRWVNFSGAVAFDKDGVASRFGGIVQDVSLQVNAQQSLVQKATDSNAVEEKNLQQLLTAFELAPVAIGILSKDNLVIKMANVFYCAIVGRSHEELIGQPMLEVLPEVAGQGFDTLINSVIQTGEPVIATEMPAQLLRNGQLQDIYVNLSYHPVTEVDGTVSGVFVVAVDVTQQVLTRQRNEQNDIRFRLLVEEAPVATCLFVGRELRIDVANEAMIQVWGKGPGVIGMPLAEALPELKGQHFLPLLDDLFTTGNSYEAKGGRADLVVNGRLQTFYFDYAFKPLRNREGAVYAILETATDVSEQVEARKKLEESREALAMAIDIAELGTYVVDLTNDTGWFDKRIQKWLGFANETVQMDAAFKAIDAEDEERVQSAIADSTLPGSDGNHDITYRIYNHATNKKGYLRSIGKSFFDTEGNPCEIRGIVQDVTSQIIYQQKIEESEAILQQRILDRTIELESLNNELKRSNANLEEFAHAASHDLKEPIRKIQFFTQKIKEEVQHKLNSAELFSFSRIENAAGRMGALIDDLLLYSEVSQLPHQTEPVNLNKVLADVLEDLELEIEQKKADIQTADLPTVQGHKRQLQQLFQNLLGNALKYSKADVPPVIHIRGEIGQGGECEVTVADNGIGFDQQYADKIFQMFARLHGKSEYSGTGVGLSIVKKVVENHRGTIRVESRPGAGSIFKLFLPSSVCNS